MAERRTVEEAAPATVADDGVGDRQRDASYANVLLDHLARDCERFDRSREWGPILLWMAEEVRRQAGALLVPRDMARRMRDQAAQAQAKVLRPTA